jgi:hypothetical protein
VVEAQVVEELQRREYQEDSIARTVNCRRGKKARHGRCSARASGRRSRRVMAEVAMPHAVCKNRAGICGAG